MANHDFSSYVTITNNLAVALSLVSGSAQIKSSHGTWSPAGPPNEIAPGATASFTLSELPNDGSSGTVSYAVPSGTKFQFTFGCPHHDDNFATVAVTVADGDCNYALPFYAVADTDTEFCACPNKNHPLHVNYAVAYRIVSVSCTRDTNTAVLDVDGNPVNPGNSIWVAGQSTPDVQGGSRTPAAFPGPGAGGAAPIVATLTIDAQTLHHFKLYARPTSQANSLTLASAKIEGQPGPKYNNDSPFGQPTAFQVQIPLNGAPATGQIASLCGSVFWDLGQPKNPIGITLLEIYWLFAKPLPMWTQGVWVQTLRDIFGMLDGDHGNACQAKVTSLMAQNCFSGFEEGKYQKTYKLDNPFGSHFYFDLYGYYNSPKRGVNCVTQQKFLYVCLGAVGIASYAVYVRPVGFINPTAGENSGLPNGLIGIDGDCNSPLSYWADTPPLDGENSPTRTWWVDHALLSTTDSADSARMLDATIGPHCGTETVDDYFTHVIDTGTDLYTYYQSHPAPPPFTAPVAANLNNFKVGPGAPNVKSVHVVAPAQAPETDRMSAILSAAGHPAPDPQASRTGLDWSSLPATLASPNSLGVRFSHVTPGVSGAMLSTRLDDAQKRFVDAHFHIESNGFVDARARMNESLSGCPRGLEEIFTVVPELEGQIGSEGVALEFRGILMAVWRDVFFCFSGNLPRPVVLALAQATVRQLQQSLPAPPVPFGSVSVTPAAPQVGERVTIGTLAGAAGDLQFHHNYPGLELAARGPQSITFRVQAPGRYEFSVFVVDPRTLHAGSRQVAFSVQR